MKLHWRIIILRIRVSQILKTALEKSYGNFSDSDKARIMRVAFNEILGEPTRNQIGSSFSRNWYKKERIQSHKLVIHHIHI